MKRILLIVAGLMVVFSSCDKDEEFNPEMTKLKITEKLDKLDVPPAMQNSDKPGYLRCITGLVIL
ncbi:MAG: hypothetical protein K9G70_02860 [Prolixibacteraceae bacterium]|nr:hypothetical protein [Prolixibacteraceae bacterium]